ncbi:chaperone SicP [Burkholderia alba]|uniref:chaperone SicP n=1 Tax=Burkholderia alba TaxID=2683677 RepID=UPI002B05D2E3|nr:chaperone SicP [Burkholderia alba]
MNTPAEWLNALSEKVCLPLDFDEHGQCFLMLDDRLMMSIRRVDDAVVLYGMLGEFPAPVPASLCMRVLAENLALSEAGGGGIGYDDDTGAMMLIERVRDAGFGADAFVDAVAAFSSRLERLIEALEAADTGDGDADAGAWHRPLDPRAIRAMRG